MKKLHDFHFGDKMTSTSPPLHKPFCFICGAHTHLVGLLLTATKQEDKVFRKEIYYQVCEQHIPRLLKALSGKRGLVRLRLWG